MNRHAFDKATLCAPSSHIISGVFDHLETKPAD
jgi:hypothetical protein